MTLAREECRSSTQSFYLGEKSGFRSVHTRFPVCLHLWPSVGWHCAHSQTHRRSFQEEQAPAKVQLTRIAFTSEDSPYNKLYWLALYTSARWCFFDQPRLFSMGQKKRLTGGTSRHLPQMPSDDVFWTSFSLVPYYALFSLGYLENSREIGRNLFLWKKESCSPLSRSSLFFSYFWVPPKTPYQTSSLQECLQHGKEGTILYIWKGNLIL